MWRFWMAGVLAIAVELWVWPGVAGDRGIVNRMGEQASGFASHPLINERVHVPARVDVW